MLPPLSVLLRTAPSPARLLCRFASSTAPLTPAKDYGVGQKLPGVYRPVYSEPDAEGFFGTGSSVIPTEHALSESSRSNIASALQNLNRMVVRKAKSAAVLVPFCHVRGEPSVLFTVRSKSLSSHSGEVSFPGGMRDSTDTSLEGTALRETQEELGIPKESVQVLGLYHDCVDKTFTIGVTPVVAYLGNIDTQTVLANRSEVDSVFTLSFRQLLDAQQRGFVVVNETTDFKMPVFKAGPYPVWGLTAYILNTVMHTTILPSSLETVGQDAQTRIRALKEATEAEMAYFFGIRTKRAPVAQK